MAMTREHFYHYVIRQTAVIKSQITGILFAPIVTSKPPGMCNGASSDDIFLIFMGGKNARTCTHATR